MKSESIWFLVLRVLFSLLGDPVVQTKVNTSEKSNQVDHTYTLVKIAGLKRRHSWELFSGPMEDLQRVIMHLIRTSIMEF